jgi:hypothetical protein
MKKNKPFVISTGSFDLGIGGIKVLHKLCDLLNRSNIEAYIIGAEESGRKTSSHTNFFIYDQYITPLAPQELLNHKNDFIAIYPESWYGNHLECNNVVRWILGPTNEDHIKTWSNKDLWFWYIPMFQNKEYNKQLQNIENQLYVGEFHRDVFKNNHLDRFTTCWTLRKVETEKDKVRLIHPSDGQFIPYQAAGQIVRLANLFNVSTHLYCYDTYTFLPIQALMCGCLSVVIPKKNISYDDFMNGFKLCKYIAYGEEDLPRAITIQNDLYQDIDAIENETKQQIQNFVEKCYDYFG